MVNFPLLLSVVIPKSVVSIEDGAFSNCNEFVKIYYHGTIEEWGNVSIQDTTLIKIDCIYLYSETEPTEDGNYWHYVDEVPVVWIVEE